MSGKASTKEQLTEAGRRKLEAFRKQKALAKKPKTIEVSKQPILSATDARTSTAEPGPTENQANGGHSVSIAGHPGPTAQRSEGGHDVPVPAPHMQPQSQPQAASAPLDSGARPQLEGHSDSSTTPGSSYTSRLPPPVPVFKKPPSPPGNGRTSSFPLPPTASRPTEAAVEEPAFPRQTEGDKVPSIAVPSTTETGAQEEELPVSSPVPSGYAALSDSYLSSGRPAGDDSSEAESEAVLDSQRRGGPSQPQASSLPLAPAAPKPEPRGTGNSFLSPSLKGFASIFSRPAEMLGDSAAAPPGERLAAQLPEKSNGHASDGVELATSERARHGRVPSLNAWNEAPPGPPGNDSTATSQGQQLEQGRRDSLEAYLSEVPNGKSASFHFSRLPEPENSTLPVWRSRSPSPRKDDSPAPQSMPGPSSSSLFPAAVLPTSGLPSWMGDSPDVARSGSLAGNGLSSHVRKEASLADLMAGGPTSGDDQFASLQQHIDELTEQKFELARGLEKQQQIAASLAAENQRLLDDYNQQGRALQQLRQELQDREAQVGAQQLAVAGIGSERDSCRSAVLEATQRSSALAAEVVALEEKYLKARSAELLALKRAEEARQAAEDAQRLQASTAAECLELRTMVATLQEEKRKWPEQLQKLAHTSEAPANGTQLTARAGGNEAAELPGAAATEVNRVPARGIVPNESEVARVVGKAVQQAAGVASGEAEGDLPELLEMLLPPRSYQGGASQEAAEVAEEERRAIASIQQLLEALRKEKEALLFSLASQQEQCRELQVRNRELHERLDALGSKPGNAASRIPGRPVGDLRAAVH